MGYNIGMRQRRRTWKVIEWKHRPKEIAAWVPIDCTCGYEAECPASIKAPIIASWGNADETHFVFDPPDFIPPANFLPDIIKCRKCGRVYE